MVAVHSGVRNQRREGMGRQQDDEEEDEWPRHVMGDRKVSGRGLGGEDVPSGTQGG